MFKVLDLTKRAWTHERGALTIAGLWAGIEDRMRPCIGIWRTADEGNEKLWPCVVVLEDAWKWTEEVGDPGHCARVSMRFCEMLRLDVHNPRVPIQLTMLIQDHIGDLVAIPPYQAQDAEAVADIVMHDRHTGAITEVEVREDV